MSTTSNSISLTTTSTTMEESPSRRGRHTKRTDIKKARSTTTNTLRNKRRERRANQGVREMETPASRPKDLVTLLVPTK